MDNIISAICFALLGAAAIKYWTSLKRILQKESKKQESKQANNMSNNDYHQNGGNGQDANHSPSQLDQMHPASTAIIYRSELDYISRCILDYPNIETGGQLYGFWTNDGVPVVLYAIGPGRNANHQVAFFVQDPEYTTNVWNVINSNSGIQHIGEWHSHHKLGLASPSGHDASTIINGMRNNNKRQFLLCIGNCTDTESTLNAFNFRYPNFSNYIHAAWDIKEIESPFRTLLDQLLQSIVIHPRQSTASHGKLKVINNNSQNNVRISNSYWLSDKANNIVLKNIIDYVNSNFNLIRTQVKLDANGLAHLVIVQENRIIDIVFTQDFPNSSPIVYITDNEGQRYDATGNFNEWAYLEDIYSSVINFLNSQLL